MKNLEKKLSPSEASEKFLNGEIGFKKYLDAQPAGSFSLKEDIKMIYSYFEDLIKNTYCKIKTSIPPIVIG